ncbi:taste receptor type 2 member 41-like [Sceloporus undulatus]|uniref:taste receptor type 2 member 41-like n=1 Tax=Sceloporus undulatus TaxID=8520 RepID=UPI001C4D166D|nr:taste receptor type 2 member 41-like [Sceloporus undulatus]
MSILNIISWIIFGIVCLIGILANGFIVVMNGQQWLQNKKMGPYDILLASLSTSRFLAQSTLLLNSLLNCCFPKTNLYNSLIKFIHFSWMFPNMVSHWCATWLNVFYCVKITNFANPLFLWIKARINVLIPRLLGMSILVSVVFYLFSLVRFFGHNECYNATGTLPGNASENQVCNNTFIVFVPLELSFSSTKFCLSTTASSLLLISLLRHTRNLKKSGLGVKDLNTQVHMKVMTSLLFYLFFYLFYFISMIIYTKSNNNEKFDRLLINILLSLFPSAHSIILILTNPKLKEMSAHILNIRHRT